MEDDIVDQKLREKLPDNSEKMTVTVDRRCLSCDNGKKESYVGPNLEPKTLPCKMCNGTGRLRITWTIGEGSAFNFGKLFATLTGVELLG